MRIDQAELRILKLPLKFRFETSFGAQTQRTIPLLTLRSGDLEGYGEGVMEDRPMYREETTGGGIELLNRFFLPDLLKQDFQNPEQVWQWLKPYRGNQMSKAMIEMAFWDLYARSKNVPLWELLGGVRTEIPVGVSLGVQSSVEETVRLAGTHLDQGYRRVKLKIKPGWDVNVVAGVREAFPDAHLTVDANSAYTLADLGTLVALDDHRLDYIEQPLAYDDLHDHVILQNLLRTPVCLDESITSPETTRKALAAQAGRVINIKVGRVGGHSEARRVHDIAQSFGVPVWCGGMLEAGIGRAHNIHLSTLPNFTKPGDTSSSSRYWAQDIINEPLEVKGGMMPVPTGPGIGVTPDWAFINTVTEQTYLTR